MRSRSAACCSSPRSGWKPQASAGWSASPRRATIAAAVRGVVFASLRSVQVVTQVGGDDGDRAGRVEQRGQQGGDRRRRRAATTTTGSTGTARPRVRIRNGSCVSMACSVACGSSSTTTAGNPARDVRASASTATGPSGVANASTLGTAIPLQWREVRGPEHHHAGHLPAPRGQVGVGGGGHRAGVAVAGVRSDHGDRPPAAARRRRPSPAARPPGRRARPGRRGRTGRPPTSGAPASLAPHASGPGPAGDRHRYPAGPPPPTGPSKRPGSAVPHPAQRPSSVSR